MAIVQGSICLLSFRGQCFGQRIILTHTVRRQTPTNVASTFSQDLQELIDASKAGANLALIPPYLACLPTTYTLTSIRAQVITPIRSAYLNEDVSMAGTHASAATVANDAAAITLRTDLAGRREVATKKIGPVPDAASSAGLLVTGYRLLLASVGLALKATFSTDDGSVYEPVIYHRDLAPAFSFVQTFALGDQSRTQRRRTVGLGE